MDDYFILTERLGFSTWKKDDAALAMALWGDPAVTQYICASGVYSEQDVMQRLHKEIESQKAHGIQYWPLYSKADNVFVGCCGLRLYNKTNRIYELGFHLKQDCWGKGYGTEAALAVIGYAYNTLGAKGLFAGHNPNNKASAKVLGKLGFVYSHDEYYPPTGLNHPSYFHNR